MIFKFCYRLSPPIRFLLKKYLQMKLPVFPKKPNKIFYVKVFNRIFLLLFGNTGFTAKGYDLNFS